MGDDQETEEKFVNEERKGDNEGGGDLDENKLLKSIQKFRALKYEYEIRIFMVTGAADRGTKERGEKKGRIKSIVRYTIGELLINNKAVGLQLLMHVGL